MSDHCVVLCLHFSKIHSNQIIEGPCKKISFLKSIEFYTEKIKYYVLPQKIGGGTYCTLACEQISHPL